MRKFTKLLFALALTIVGVQGVKAQEEVDIPLVAENWTWGWGSNVSVTDGVMSIELTGDYGAGGTGWDPAADWSAYAKLCVVVDSYPGGWGQVIVTFSDNSEASQTMGNISSPTTITVDIENNPKSSGVKKIAIQGGTNNPTIKVSRVYLVKKLEYEDPKDVAFDEKGYILAENIAQYSNSAKVEFTLTFTKVAEKNYIGWGIGKVQSADGSINCFEFALKNEGDNIYTCTMKDLRAAIEAPANGEGIQGLQWMIWGQGTSDGNVFTRKSVKVYEVKNLASVVVGEAGWTTFSYNKAIGLGGVTAYSAKNMGSYVKLTPVTAAPAGAGVIIEASQGTYKIPTLDDADDLENNDLQVSDGNVEGDGTIYVLAKKNDKVGFYKLADGDKVPVGKAYLKITGSSAPEFLGFGGGDTTSISELNVKGQADGTYFNLAGQRVAQPTKGLYIMNGKKYIVK